MLVLLGTLIERLGIKAAAVVLVGAGLVEILPKFHVPVEIVRGVSYFGIGLGLLAFGKRQKKAQDQFIASEAEKRIDNPALSKLSSVPAIQREILKQTAKEPF